MIWSLIGIAMAAPQVQSETVVEIRHDLFGQPIVPVFQYLRLTEDEGPVSVDGYLGLEAASDGGSEHPRIYAFNAAGNWRGSDWRVGTQTVLLPSHPQTMDGGRLAVPLAPGAGEVTMILGNARRHDLDDLAAGVGLGRLEWRVDHAQWAARAGVQTEVGAGPVVGRQDLELRAGNPRQGQVAALVAIAEPGPGLEWGRIEARTWMESRVEVTGWVERRETIVETLLADDILGRFSESPVDEVGGRLRLVDARRNSVAASYGIGRYTPVDVAATTHRFDVEWRSSRPTIPRPAWRFRTGPGGEYHAVSVQSVAPLLDDLALVWRGAAIPYRRGSDVWRLAGTAGGDLVGPLGHIGRLAVGADAASDAVWAIDLRAHVALTLGVM